MRTQEPRWLVIQCERAGVPDHFTASIAGLKGDPGVSVYVASKHAVIGLARSLMKETGPLGIRVNVAHIEGDDLLPRIDGLRPQIGRAHV